MEASFTLRPLYSRVKKPDTHWLGYWMGPRAGLDALKRKSLSSLESNTNSTRTLAKQMCPYLRISLSVATRLSVRNVLGNSGLFLSHISGNVSRAGPCFFIVSFHNGCDLLRNLPSRSGRNSCFCWMMRQENNCEKLEVLFIIRKLAIR